MKVILSAVLDTDKALLEGREVGAALTDGLIAGTVSAAGEGLKKGITYVLDRTAVPIVASVLDKPSAVASEYLTGITKKVGEDRAKKGLQAAARNGGVTHGLTQARPDTNSWDTALSFGDHDELLLKLAVIDMKKGIGHSWW
jgi:hypothetical protein